MPLVDIVFSVAVTWGVGLGLPAIVRHVMYRRPLESFEALPWALLLALGELFLFTAMGSTSKTHAVLILIGIVAYRILVARTGRFDRNRSERHVPPFSAAQAKPVHDEASSSPAAQAQPGRDDCASDQSRSGVVALDQVSRQPLSPQVSRLGGWKRLWIVVSVCWLATVGGRVVFELSGDASETFLVDKRSAWAEFERSDFRLAESFLLAALSDEVARKKQSEDAHLTDITRAVVRSLDERAAKFERRLSEFSLPALTDERAARLARELAVPVTTIYERREIAQRLLRVRELEIDVPGRPLLEAHVFNWRPATYSVGIGKMAFILIVGLIPPLFLLAVGLVIRWISQGFRAQS